MLKRPPFSHAAHLNRGMSGAPSHPSRQRTPPSPNHHHHPPPSSTMSNPRPPFRPTQYHHHHHHHHRYYRSGMSSSSTSLVGWTPRTAAAPHAPLSQRSHSRHSASTSHLNHHHQPPPPPPGPPSSSPRTNTSSASLSSKPSLSQSIPRSASPSVPSKTTPSWLKGNYSYRTQLLPVSSSNNSVLTVEEYCKTRIRDIKKTIQCETEAVPELRKVMINLESSKITDEINLVSSIRKEFWQARKRQRKASADLRKIEREIRRINIHSDHINGKINRLRAYAKFIESGWQDEHLLNLNTSSSTEQELDQSNQSETTSNQQQEQSNQTLPSESNQSAK